ncbi:MAG: insulinase family protein [Candidatus Shikimatogenerans sp. Tduv]|uniref:Insulinase family protein n=1 Tax=Candidatus Shikimatogenerans sp. Tduv TaxID=3158567 RepID=A0AAU7QR24_9FLAO
MKNINNNILNFNILKYKLKNGINIILNKNKNNYIISNNFFFHVGAKNNFNNDGLFYFLEKYIMKGKNNIKNKNYNKYILNNGGIMNSFSTYDGTYFNNIITPNLLEVSLYTMLKKFNNIIFKKKNILNIINYIKKKKKKKFFNKPYVKLFYKIIPKYLFFNHPYKNTIIGNIKKIKKYSISKLKSKYKKYYSPNNMVISISGNISFSKTLKLIKKYFNNYNYKKYNFINKIKKIDFKKKKNITLKEKYINFPIGILLYKLPNMSHRDLIIIKFIYLYLTYEYNNFLLKKIKEKNINIININLKINIMEKGGYIIIYYIVKDKIYIKPILKIIKNIFNNLSNYGIPKKKINIYKKIYLKNKILDNLYNYNISINLINYLVFYKNVNYFIKEINIINNINNILLMNIIKKYFLKENIIFIND